MTAQVRASWAKTVIGAAKRLDPELRVRALGAMPDDARAHIRETGTLGWIDADLMVRLCAPVHDALADDAPRLWSLAMRLAIEAPLLRPLRAGAFSLFGKDPYNIVKMTPRVWGLLTRECGECRCHRPGPELARIELHGLAAPLRAHAAFVAGIAGASEAMVAMCGFEADVRTHLATLADGDAAIEAAWHPS